MEEKDRQRFMTMVEIGDPADCWRWRGGHASRDGYPAFWMGGRTIRAHRLMLEMRLGRPIEPGRCACHSCDHPWCVNPSHLLEGTHAENMAQARDRRRIASGEAHFRAKLTDAEIQEVRRRYAAGDVSQRALAKEYGVSKSTMQANLTGVTRIYAEGDRVVGLPQSRLKRGERNARSILTEAQVVEIRERVARGERLKNIAKAYGVSEGTVDAICAGTRWSHSGGPIRPPRQTLTAVGAERIREEYAKGGVTQTELAKREGCSKSTVQAIIAGRLYPAR